MKRLIILVGIVTAWIAHATDRLSFDWGSFERLAVLERGRLKPVQTFAEETVQFVTGKRRFENRPAVETCLGWLLEFEEKWQAKKFIRTDYAPIKKRLGLSETEKYFSPEELTGNERLSAWVREIAVKQRSREKLSEVENKVVTLQNQLGLVEAFRAGSTLSLLPNPQGLFEDWFPIQSLNEGRLPYTGPQLQKANELFQTAFKAFVDVDAVTWNQTIPKLGSFLREDLARGAYPAESEISREVHFNSLRPFRWSWVLYAAAFVSLVISLVTGAAISKRLGGVFLGAGLLMHTYGFILRCWISGRPPVTNMYESVIWVSLGTVVFSVIIWLVYRNLIIPTAATVFSVVALVLADNLPAVLDPGIHPLEPVLRSNFWLTTHVLCITLSYSAFALSLCMGNVVLGNFLFRPRDQAQSQRLSLYMYRAMQIGVILVAAGTILGGVWADYSWGRFWGWDPKEVWALIVLLLYVAVLHGRMAGWLKEFGFAATTVFCFLGVLMAWYGVNFVLGVGLHSYGFGSGGLSYVLGYVLVQTAFIVAAWVRYKKQGTLM